MPTTTPAKAKPVVFKDPILHAEKEINMAAIVGGMYSLKPGEKFVAGCDWRGKRTLLFEEDIVVCDKTERIAETVELRVISGENYRIGNTVYLKLTTFNEKMILSE